MSCSEGESYVLRRVSFWVIDRRTDLRRRSVQHTFSMSLDWKPPEYPRDPGEFSISGSGELTLDDHD